MPSPSTSVLFLKNIGLDRDLQHTYRFASLYAQQKFFKAKAKVVTTDSDATNEQYVFNNLQYQRVNDNSIKVSTPVAFLYDCNYMMFQNEGYKDASGRTRWFYAFIDSVDYVNENTSIVNYSIDPLQTWYFDFSIGDCMVEREHVQNDGIGANIISEPVTAGEYIKVVEKDWLSENKDYNACLVLSKPFPTVLSTTHTDIDVSRATYSFSSQAKVDYDFKTPLPMAGFSSPYKDAVFFKESFSDTNNGFLPTNLSWYADIPLLNEKASGVYATDNTILDLTEPKYYSITALLNWIGNGYIDGLTAEDIVCVFIYPKFLSESVTTPVHGGYTVKEITCDLTTDTPFIGSKNYIPKNNKLYTSPYSRILVSNKAGSQAEYRAEWFKNLYKPTFIQYAFLSGVPSYCLYPTNYKGKGLIENTVITNYDIEIPYVGNAYAEYIRNNRGKLISSTLNSIVSAGTSIAIGNLPAAAQVITKHITQKSVTTARNPNTGRQITTGTGTNTTDSTMKVEQKNSKSASINGVANGLSNMVSLCGELYDQHNKPNPVYGNMANADITAMLRENSICVFRESIDGGQAETIDNFFTMYGYAVKRIKQVGIYNRENWVYIKTVNCILHSKSSYADYVNYSGGVKYSTGMNAEDMETIETIFDRGITFWNPNAEIGDYSQSNGTLYAVRTSTDITEVTTGKELGELAVTILLDYSNAVTVQTLLPSDRSVVWQKETYNGSDVWEKTTTVAEGENYYRACVSGVCSTRRYIKGV